MPSFNCHTHLQLSYTPSTVMHTENCHAHLQLIFTPSTDIHTFYCYSHLKLLFTPSTVIHTFYCYSHIQLLFTPSNVIHTYHCQTYLHLLSYTFSAVMHTLVLRSCTTMLMHCSRDIVKRFSDFQTLFPLAQNTPSGPPYTYSINTV